MSIEEALVAFVKAVLNQEIGTSEKSRVCLELKEFSPVGESELTITFGYQYAGKNKVVLWSSDKQKFPQTLTVEQGVREFLQHYKLI